MWYQSDKNDWVTVSVSLVFCDAAFLKSCPKAQTAHAENSEIIEENNKKLRDLFPYLSRTSILDHLK